MRKETLRGSADRGCLQRRRTALRPRPRPGAVRAAGLPHAPPIGAAVNSSDLRSTVDMQLLPSEVSVCGRCASPPVRVVRGEEPTDSASFPSASDAGHDDPPRPGGLLCMVVFFFLLQLFIILLPISPPTPPAPAHGVPAQRELGADRSSERDRRAARGSPAPAPLPLSGPRAPRGSGAALPAANCRLSGRAGSRGWARGTPRRGGGAEPRGSPCGAAVRAAGSGVPQVRAERGWKARSGTPHHPSNGNRSVTQSARNPALAFRSLRASDLRDRAFIKRESDLL